jgi:AAA-like domain/Effector-associated domain 5
MTLLPHPEIVKLYEAARSAGLVRSRDALLTGLDEGTCASLPQEPSPADQILRDLGALNATPALADGSVPLSTWLANAAVLAGPKVEAAFFKEVQVRIETAPSQPPPRISLSPPTSSIPPRVYVHRPAEEHAALDILAQPGKPLVIWAPARYGKAYLLKHLLHHVRAADGEDSRIVEIDLAICLPDPPSLDGLVEQLCALLVRRLGADRASLQDVADTRLGWPLKLQSLLEDNLLPSVPHRLVLAVRNADAVCGTPFQRRFFEMLHSFCDSTMDPWPRLRLVLLLSSHPSAVFEGTPLTDVAQTIELGDFTVEQTEELARENDLTWDRTVIEGHLRPLVPPRRRLRRAPRRRPRPARRGCPPGGRPAAIARRREGRGSGRTRPAPAPRWADRARG